MQTIQHQQRLPTASRELNRAVAGPGQIVGNEADSESHEHMMARLIGGVAFSWILQAIRPASPQYPALSVPLITVSVVSCPIRSSLRNR